MAWLGLAALKRPTAPILAVNATCKGKEAKRTAFQTRE